MYNIYLFTAVDQCQKL